jgi:hypothetical protein
MYWLVIAGLALAVFMLPVCVLVANAVPDSTEPAVSSSGDLSNGQIIGIIVSVGVALVGLWLMFRKPKSKQVKIIKKSVATRRL